VIANALNLPNVFDSDRGDVKDAVSSLSDLATYFAEISTYLTAEAGVPVPAALLVGSMGPDTILGRGGSESLYAFAGHDSMLGLAGNDVLHGGSGREILNGGAGADFLDGGLDFDFASYADSPSGVFARLDAGSGAFGEAQGDTYSGNMLYGNDGVDQLTGGAGADVLDGGASFDFTRYDLAASGVVVRLDQGGGTAGDALWDTYVSVEGAVGSEHPDVIVGSAEGNYIFGIGGNDCIYGFGGYDEIYGGGGADAFVFRASDLAGGVSTIRDFSAAEEDAVFLEGVDPSTVSAYQSDGDVVIAAAGGGGIVLAGTTLAQLDGHLVFI
jgi:serralysin